MPVWRGSWASREGRWPSPRRKAFYREDTEGRGRVLRGNWLNLACQRRLEGRYSTSNIEIRGRVWAGQHCIARVRAEFADRTRWCRPRPGRVCRWNKVVPPTSGEGLPIEQDGVAHVPGGFANRTRWDCPRPRRVCRQNKVVLPTDEGSLPIPQGGIARRTWWCRRRAGRECRGAWENTLANGAFFLSSPLLRGAGCGVPRKETRRKEMHPWPDLTLQTAWTRVCGLTSRRCRPFSHHHQKPNAT